MNFCYRIYKMKQKMAPAIVAKIQKAQKLIHAGKLAKAEDTCRKILKKIPDQPDTLHLLGLIALRNEQYERTQQYYAKALKAHPDNPAYHYNLGIAYIHTQQFESAIKSLIRATELDPNLAGLYSDLCLALVRANNFEAAIKAGGKAVLQAPDHANAHFHLALAYHGWKDFDSSCKHHLKASQLSPDSPELLFGLGNAYYGRNELEKAKQCYSGVYQLEPENYIALYSMVNSTRYSTTDHEDLHRLKVLEKQKHLTDEGRTSVLFSLAKIYQDCGLHDEAFCYFERGNTLQAKKYPFSTVDFTAYVSSMVKFHTKELLTEKNRLGNPSTSPVIIVGTPRSGTTLVEQILSSHHDVFGAGELEWVGIAAHAIQGYLETDIPYPECTQALSKSNINELAEKYHRYLHTLAGKESRITDKMPNNFLHLGLIHILFPNARIIHCRREPKDACTSMFCQYFPGGHSISHDMFKLGVYYKQYQRLMAHWRAVLPTDTMIEVDYEKLVTSQEAESRRLIDFIGLKWDDACLDFYKKKRQVVTASSKQVTKPIYTSSIARWKRYEKYLQPLEDGLIYSGNSEHSQLP